MPDNPLFAEMIPQALEELAVWEGPVTRKDVESLLAVSRRQAIRILEVAGALPKPGVRMEVQPEQLAAYLMTKVDGGILRRETERRSRFLDWLDRARRARVAGPHCWVQVRDEKLAEVLAARLDRLPPGVKLVYGELAIRFETRQELLEKLLAFAVALDRDMDQLERFEVRRTA